MHRRTGFTLIEMMVAVAVLGIVTAQIFYVFSAQKETFTTNDRALEAQHQARTVLDFLEYDVRQAGMMVPPQVGVSAVTGGAGDGVTPAPDRLCVSDPSGFEFPTGGASAPSLERATPFDAYVTSYNADWVDVESLDIDGYTRPPDPTGTSDFKVGSGIIVSDGFNTHCARIESITGNRIRYAAAHRNNPLPAYDNTPANDRPLRAVPAHVYEVDTATLQLKRNNLVLDSGIEDFQVEFWMDSQNPDGQIGGAEWPIADLQNPGIPTATNRIGRVRITVLSRTEVDELDGIAGDNQRPAIADAVAANDPDNFSRRLFTASVLPRNLGKNLNLP